MQDLRDLARGRESLTVVVSSTKNEIKRILQILFPELESLGDVFSQTMLYFLEEFTSARIIKTANPRAIAKAFEHSDKRKKISVSSDEIIKAAKQSVASFSPAKELILSGKISTLFHLQKRLDEITMALTDFCESMMVEDLKIIKSIKGINTKTAAPFLAEMGNINDFSSYKNLIAFAGIDPTIHQSGKFEGKSTISKRGNRHLRRVIFLMAKHVKSRQSFLENILLKKKKRKVVLQRGNTCYCS